MRNLVGRFFRRNLDNRSDLASNYFTSEEDLQTNQWLERRANEKRRILSLVGNSLDGVSKEPRRKLAMAGLPLNYWPDARVLFEYICAPSASMANWQTACRHLDQALDSVVVDNDSAFERAMEFFFELSQIPPPQGPLLGTKGRQGSEAREAQERAQWVVEMAQLRMEATVPTYLQHRERSKLERFGVTEGDLWGSDFSVATVGIPVNYVKDTQALFDMVLNQGNRVQDRLATVKNLDDAIAEAPIVNEGDFDRFVLSFFGRCRRQPPVGPYVGFALRQKAENEAAENRALEADRPRAELHRRRVSERRAIRNLEEGAHGERTNDRLYRRPETMWTPRDAEEGAAEWLRDHGFPNTRPTPLRADGGIDALGSGVVAQVKWQESEVGRPAVQAFMGAAATHPGHARFFFAKHGFGKLAMEYADRPEVQIRLLKYDRYKQDFVPCSAAARQFLAGSSVSN